MLVLVEHVNFHWFPGISQLVAGSSGKGPDGVTRRGVWVRLELMLEDTPEWREPWPVHCYWPSWSQSTTQELNYGMQTLNCSMKTPSCCGIWDLVPWPRIKPRPPALGIQSSPLDHHGSPCLEFLNHSFSFRACGWFFVFFFFIFSISSWFSFGRLYFSKNLSIPPPLPRLSILLAYSCL